MSREHRRAPRRVMNSAVLVYDCMTDAVVGRIGNLSESGMLLIASAPLREDALYQLRFTLPQSTRSSPVQAGSHLLWLDRAHSQGHGWAGLRFISLGNGDQEALRAWVAAGPAMP